MHCPYESTVKHYFAVYPAAVQNDGGTFGLQEKHLVYYLVFVKH